MVLSNKKLKQQLRAKLAESLAAKEASKQVEDGSVSEPYSEKAHSLQQLLSSATQKPRLSKREIRRRKLPLLNPDKDYSETTPIGSTNTEENKENNKNNNNNKKKNKKRKRTDSLDQERADGQCDSTAGKSENEETKKKENKKKKKKKKKVKKKKKKNNEKKEQGESNVEVGRVELPKVEQSQENGDVPTKVYAGGIPYYSTEDDIRSFFESCGTITELDCVKFPDSGKFRGIAMITFKTEAAAKRALALDGADMGGLFLKIQQYKTMQVHKSSDFTPELVGGYNRIYVGNLSWDITEDELRKLFSDCKISSIRFGMDQTTGEFRGYAHVDFYDRNSLMIGLKLDQKVVCGRPVRITSAVQKKDLPTRFNSNFNSEFSASEKAENDASLSNGKKQRRTCYECGVPGHLSSSCPQNRGVEEENS